MPMRFLSGTCALICLVTATMPVLAQSCVTSGPEFVVIDVFDSSLEVHIGKKVTETSTGDFCAQGTTIPADDLIVRSAARDLDIGDCGGGTSGGVYSGATNQGAGC